MIHNNLGMPFEILPPVEEILTPRRNAEVTKDLLNLSAFPEKKVDLTIKEASELIEKYYHTYNKIYVVGDKETVELKPSTSPLASEIEVPEFVGKHFFMNPKEAKLHSQIKAYLSISTPDKGEGVFSYYFGRQESDISFIQTEIKINGEVFKAFIVYGKDALDKQIRLVFPIPNPPKFLRQ